MHGWFLSRIVAIAILGLMISSGCGKPSATEINGKVTLDGQPVEGVEVQVMPIASNVAAFAGVSGADGAFKILIVPGAKFESGKYKVTATKYVAKGDTKGLAGTPGIDVTQLRSMGLANNTLPTIYESPQQTPITLDITPQTALIDVPLKSK